MHSSKLPVVAIILTVFLFSCRSKPSKPDVSGIRIQIKTSHFEKGLFSVDSNRFGEGISRLWTLYPDWEAFYMSRILNADPTLSDDSITGYVKSFVSAYRNVYDTSQVLFRDFSPYEKEIREGMTYCQYYFPEYSLPKKIYTYIGPLDGYGDIMITGEIFAVALHHHLGKNYSLYASDLVNQIYPRYITNQFEPEYIAINCMKNVINDMFPDASETDKGNAWKENMTLVNKMVENGKRLYLLSRLLPDKDEYMLIGYTKEQMEDCLKNERYIWNFFSKNNLLQCVDMSIMKNYISEGPKTQELGESVPGNIGTFAGWQIVKKYMGKHPEKSMKDLMRENPEKIMEEAKYKP